MNTDSGPLRFSLKSLMRVVTAICLFLGSWQVTKAFSGSDGMLSLDTGCVALKSQTLAPFLVVDQEDATNQYVAENGLGEWNGRPKTQLSYYLWFFGPRIYVTSYYDDPSHVLIPTPFNSDSGFTHCYSFADCSRQAVPNPTIALEDSES